MKINAALIASSIAFAALVLKAQNNNKLTAKQKQTRAIQFLKSVQ